MIQGIKKGDVVQLKSGGPLMTVQTVNTGIANCVWFDDGQNLRFADFSTDILAAKQ